LYQGGTPAEAGTVHDRLGMARTLAPAAEGRSRYCTMERPQQEQARYIIKSRTLLMQTGASNRKVVCNSREVYVEFNAKLSANNS
jgi:hypothetical protein